MTTVKVLISYHKPSVLLKDEIMVPIHCGRAHYARKFALGGVPKDEYEWMMENTIGDDSGDNISLEQDFNEAQAIYWAWKNYEKLENPDYIGFMHYRRHFIFKNIKKFPNNHKNVIVSFKRLNDRVLREIGYSSDAVQNIVCNNDVVAVNPLNSNMTVYEYYKNHHIIAELDFCIEAIRRDHPVLYPYAKAFFNQNLNSICNMFIMQKALFFNYCQFFFDIAFKFMKNFDRSNYSVEDSRSFVLERMTGLYLYYLSQQNGLRYTTLPITFIEQPQIIPDYHPAFAKNNIPVVFSSDDKFFKFTATALQSIIDNSNTQNNYDIFIMCKNISCDYKEKLAGLVKGHDNFSIRYASMDDFLDLFEADVNTETTYYRLWIPKIFNNFKKILYLDSDIVAEKDIAELFFTDIGNCLLGAAPDIGVFRIAHRNHELSRFIQKYAIETLKLASLYDYVQAGVLLFNVEAMNRFGFFDECFKFLSKNPKPYYKDQDVINFVCRDSIFRFAVKWNVEWHCVFFPQDAPLNKALPKQFYEAYMDARRDTYILHFSGCSKPWAEPDKPMANVFWKYARRAPFYEVILSDMMISVAAKTKQNTRNPYSNPNHLWLLKKIIGFFKCLRENGLKYTTKLVIKKISKA